MTSADSLIKLSRIDYQRELVTIWLESLKLDKSGIYENSIVHGDGCKCCTKLPFIAGQGRGRL